MIKKLCHVKYAGLIIALIFVLFSWLFPMHGMAQECGYGTSAQDCQHQLRDDAAREEYNRFNQSQQQGQEDINYDSTPPMPHKEIHWGAIAIDKKKVLVNDKELKFMGVSSMKKTMEEAQKAALEMCESDGSNDCEVVESVPNQCLSISIAKDNGMAYFFAPTVHDSMAISQMKCNQAHKDCKVAYTACSYADF
ncbi:MAG: DUF4189 domain-containing protein [Methylococcaceae bacterium]|nr:DUF4189 domain-containing protein [Methylococcaceae bacterium]